MRLTRKNYQEQVSDALDTIVCWANINPNDVCKFPVDDLREQELKLGQLEDIEEELGIDLITFFKLMKKNDHIYYRKGNKIKEGVLTYGPVSKYGKTWALTKEELL